MSEASVHGSIYSVSGQASPNPCFPWSFQLDTKHHCNAIVVVFTLILLLSRKRGSFGFYLLHAPGHFATVEAFPVSNSSVRQLRNASRSRIRKALNRVRTMVLVVWGRANIP